MADISDIQSTEAILEIKHPRTEKALGISVTLLSIADSKLSTLKRQITDRRIKLEQRGKSIMAEEIEENGYNIAFAALTGWSWGKDEDGVDATFHGKKPEFNRTNVIQVFTELPWFLEQINIKIGETKDFFAK